MTTKEVIEAVITAAITGNKIQLPDEINLEEIYRQLKRHSLVTIGYTGLVMCGVEKNHPTMQQLFMDYLKLLRISEMQTRAADGLLSAFAQAGIEHLPLKGYNLKKLYPKQEFRLMGDVDILIKKDRYPDIEEIVRAQGYEFSTEMQHTRNWKSENLYLELHHQLVPSSDKDFYDYFGDGWEKARQKENYTYGYSPEDELIFIFIHYAKHFRQGGIGYRQLIDIWVHTAQNKDIDYTYVESELTKLKLDVFFKNTMSTISACFEGGGHNEITHLISSFIFESGSWGSVDSGILSKAVRDKATGDSGKVNAKLYSFFSLLFPSADSLKIKYKFLKEKPWLLPAVWVIRWFDVLLNRRKNISVKLKRSNKVSDDALSQRQRFYDAIGLSSN